MSYWLVKTEPEVYSIDHLKRDRKTAWTCVRNYQARNYLRNMRIGDRVLVYHSNSEPAGVIGIAEVCSDARPDPTQFEESGEYFDSKATPENPRWFCPDLKFIEKFPRLVSISELKQIPELKQMVLFQRGSRLSVQPVTEKEFESIVHTVNKL